MELQNMSPERLLRVKEYLKNGMPKMGEDIDTLCQKIKISTGMARLGLIRTFREMCEDYNALAGSNVMNVNFNEWDSIKSNIVKVINRVAAANEEQ